MFARDDNAERRSLLEKHDVGVKNQHEGVGTGTKSESVDGVGGSLDPPSLGAAPGSDGPSGSAVAVPTMGPPSDRALAGKSVLVDEASDLVIHSSRLTAAFYGSPRPDRLG